MPLTVPDAPGNQAAPAAKSPPQPGRRILVVDDEKLVCRLVGEVLTDSGYRVDAAEDGEAAWNKLQAARHEPDSYCLLITDNQMPRMSGIELIKKVRAGQMTLPIILASGTPPTNDENIHLAESLQPVAILPKPFTIFDLMWIVKKVLASAHGNAPENVPQVCPAGWQVSISECGE